MLCNDMLFNLHEFECFWVFSLRVVSNFRPLWSDKILDMISMILNLLRLLLCPIMCSIFKNVPCAFEECVFCLFGMKSSLCVCMSFQHKEAKYTFFSNAHGTFSKIDSMIGYKQSSINSRKLKSYQAFSHTKRVWK